MPTTILPTTISPTTISPTTISPTTTEPASERDLQQQIAEAVADTALPISQLLRLMWALDADQSAVNENLRAQLRARIGAPLGA